MILVLRIFHTHSVHALRFFAAAFLTKPASVTNSTAGIAALSAFLAYHGAIRAMAAGIACFVTASAMATI